MAMPSPRKQPKRRGPPKDPQSLRSRGVSIRLRIPPELHKRAHAAAGDEGLSAVIRRLLEAWLAAGNSRR
jgi:hypothetical protein